MRYTFNGLESLLIYASGHQVFNISLIRKFCIIRGRYKHKDPHNFLLLHLWTYNNTIDNWSQSPFLLVARVLLKIEKIWNFFIMNHRYHSYSSNLKNFFINLMARYLLFNIGDTGVPLVPKGLRFLTYGKNYNLQHVMLRFLEEWREKLDRNYVLCRWRGINGPIQNLLLCSSRSFTCKTCSTWFRWKFSLL